MQSNANQSFITESQLSKTKQSLRSISSVSPSVLDRGVKQAADFWTDQDGTQTEFKQFCERYVCRNPQEKEALFYRLCDNFEAILGHSNSLAIELLKPTQLVNQKQTAVDEIFGAYNNLSHFYEDMFQNKVAFIVILNFPHFTLTEKNNNGSNWTTLEWGYVRLGDLFTHRGITAAEEQKISNATAAADNYISNYNIYMDQLWSDGNETFWQDPSFKLISHWGLRDELKACYADSDRKRGTEKQRVIYNVMKRIIDQQIPMEAINQHEFIWYPSSNQLFTGRVEMPKTPENGARYQYMLNIFNAVKATDHHYGEHSTFIDRKFDDEYEISVHETEQLFRSLLGSEQVKEVAKLISKRLQRNLEPFDIWYDGFKSRSSMDQAMLDKTVREKYPDKEAFVKDLPRILRDLGFSAEKAQFICDHVTVDASVGAGHAWESMMKSDNARLRTRIGENGMDYKGYNIGIHEFGHNVEQTVSLHDVPNYFLRGVPNTAFTEALAFIFQARDLKLLGIENEIENEALNTLDNFWSCYEIMGVSLVDIKIWQWLYHNPDATATQLKNAVIDIAKSVWNEFYEPVFNKKDQTILAIYSHMIDAPLYLSMYPIGHLIDFQINNYMKNKNIGTEVERIYQIGRKTPAIWMQEAIGEKLSVNSLLSATSDALKQINTDTSRSSKKH